MQRPFSVFAPVRAAPRNYRTIIKELEYRDNLPRKPAVE